MRYFSRILFLLGATFSSVALSHAQTLTVKDDLEPHSPINYLEQFSTTLTAHVDNPPASNDEIQVTGPTYQWNKTGGTDSVLLSSNQGTTVGLNSDYPPHSSSSINGRLSYGYGSVGSQSVGVNCTATYTQSWKDSSKTARLDPLTYSASKQVIFFVVAPDHLKSLDLNPSRGVVSSGEDPNGDFYHAVDYEFEILDNQPTPQLYARAKIQEEFDSSSYKPNPDYAVDLAAQKAPGPANGSPSAVAKFYDHNNWQTSASPFGATPSTPRWRLNSIAETKQKGPSDFWFSFGQTWVCLEDVPNTVGYTIRTPLTPHYVVQHLRDYVVRN